MDNQQIFAHIDHTLLKATANNQQISLLCEQAQRFGAAAVCIPPAFVQGVHKQYPSLNICTVVGFPLGYSTTKSKIFAARELIANGAAEIDMVINLGYVKNRQINLAMDEVARLKQAVADKLLKVIIETCYLTQAEKEQIAKLFPATGADYLKTSTGFGIAGAQLADIQFFRAALPMNIKLKAAGGIRDKQAMEAFIQAGAERLGCSGAVEVLFGAAANQEEKADE